MTVNVGLLYNHRAQSKQITVNLNRKLYHGNPNPKLTVAYKKKDNILQLLALILAILVGFFWQQI